MKKVLVCLFCLFGAAHFLPAQTLDVYTILVPGFLDDPNPVRFSPLNLVDSDPTTVFAIPFAKAEPPKPLITLNLSAPIRLDGLRIRAGWFDEKLFRVNNRAKQVKVWVKQTNGALIPAQPFPLKDQMVPQDLVFSKPVEAVSVFLTVPEVYPGSKNKDLVISGLEGLVGGQALALTRVTEGPRITSITEEYRSWSDDHGRILLQQTAGNLAGGRTQVFFYGEGDSHPVRETVLGPSGLWDSTWDIEYEGQTVRRAKVGDPTLKQVVQSVSNGTQLIFDRETLTQGDQSSETLYQYVVVEPDVFQRVPVICKASPSGLVPGVNSLYYKDGVLQKRILTQIAD